MRILRTALPALRSGSAVLLVMALTAACDVRADDPGRRGGVSPSASASESSESSEQPAGKGCSDSPSLPEDRCSSVHVDGRLVRYRLLPAGTPTDQTLLVDVGGPGASVLAGGYDPVSLRRALGDETMNLLLIEEPWVTRTPTQECREALRAFYRSLARPVAGNVSGDPAPAEKCSVGSSPRLWGFSAETLVDGVRAIETAERVRVRAFLGFSFGSVRLTYLKPLDLMWAVLVDPFPLEVPGSRINDGRQAWIGKVAERFGSSGGRVPESADAFSYYSALVELGYLNAEQLDLHGAAVVRGRDSELIGQLSTRLWQTYGDDDLSPAFLAMLDEVCPVTTWPRSSTADQVSSVRGVLDAAVRPCHGGGDRVARVAELPSHGCAVITVADSVTPGVLAAESLAGRVGWSVISVPPSAGHGSDENVRKCLRRVQDQAAAKTTR